MLQNIKSTLTSVAVGAGITLLGAGGVYLYLHREPPTAAPTAPAVPAAVAPEVKKAQRVSVTLPVPVKAYAPGIKGTLKLPDSIVADQNQHVIAAARVRSSDRPQTVTTVLDAATGESRAYVKEEALPWLALDPHGEAGIYAGLKNGERTARLEVRQGLVQIKAVHLGAIASLDQPLSGQIKSDHFVGVGAWYRW